MGSGESAYASPARAAGTKRCRGTLRMAASVRGSRTPRSSTWAATIASRARAGSSSRVTVRTGRAQPSASAAAATITGRTASVGLGEVHLARGRFAAVDAGPRRRLTLDGDHAHGGLRLLLDGGLAGGVPAPPGDDEPPAVGHDLLELVVPGDPRRVVRDELARPRQQVGLEDVEPFLHGRGQTGQGQEGLLAGVPPHQHGLVLLDVPGTDLQPQGRAPHLQSAYLKPGWCWSRSSRWARIPAP